MAQGKGNSVQRRRQKAEGAVPISAAGEGGGEGPRAGPSLSGPVGRGEVRAVTVPKKSLRPGYGRAGRGTLLGVNYFKTSLSKRVDVHHYNV